MLWILVPIFVAALLSTLGWFVVRLVKQNDDAHKQLGEDVGVVKSDLGDVKLTLSKVCAKLDLLLKIYEKGDK